MPFSHYPTSIPMRGSYTHFLHFQQMRDYFRNIIIFHKVVFRRCLSCILRAGYSAHVRGEKKPLFHIKVPGSHIYVCTPDKNTNIIFSYSAMLIIMAHKINPLFLGVHFFFFSLAHFFSTHSF